MKWSAKVPSKSEVSGNRARIVSREKRIISGCCEKSKD